MNDHDQPLPETESTNAPVKETEPISNTEPVVDTTQPSAEVPVPGVASKSTSSKKKKILIIGLIVALIAAAGGYYYWQNKKEPAANNQQSDAKTEADESSLQSIGTAEEQALMQKFLNPTTGEKWLTTRKSLTKQGFYKLEDDEVSAEYFEVGSRDGNTIIMSALPQVGYEIRLYEKSASGKVTLISRPDGDKFEKVDDSNDQYLRDSTRDDITIDATRHYDSLTLPRKLDIGKGYSLPKLEYPTLGELELGSDNQGVKTSRVRKVGQSTIYMRETTYTDTKLTSIGYILKTPLATAITLYHQPLEEELNNYSWQSGKTKVEDMIKGISKGCGGLSASVTRADDVTESQLKLVGKSPSGKSVYELKDSNHAIINKAYEEFTDFNKDLPDEKYASISKEEFIKEHGVLFHKDAYGQWLVYSREQLSPAYGCAKPVVYLYPTSQQQVKVRVGANIKISDPYYNPRGGWSVLANPSGQLQTNGRSYDSLFWEGPGIGQYPAVTQGSVVATGQAVSTIRQNLGQLGLNAKEIDDFITYWRDKLPNKPFTRLTWLTTEQMNGLAPLYITPKPDTTIRVFLDFAGLDQPIKLTPQKLTSLPRQGFTVVEWGGLSPKRLY